MCDTRHIQNGRGSKRGPRTANAVAPFGPHAEAPAHRLGRWAGAPEPPPTGASTPRHWIFEVSASGSSVTLVRYFGSHDNVPAPSGKTRSNAPPLMVIMIMQSEKPPLGFLAPIHPLASKGPKLSRASMILARVMALGPSVATILSTACWNSTPAIQAWAPQDTGVGLYS